MRSLPLFHSIAGQPVVVLGGGAAAEAKQRLVERAGGKVVTDLADGIERGARLAFIAHDNPDLCEADAIRARNAGLLVNVVDRPSSCDFTVPSLLDRDPVLIAVGTAGASAGLAKQLRLRLEAYLPADLGLLAQALEAARGRLRRVFPAAGERRQALDAALGPGGPLDPLASDAHRQVEAWLDDATPMQPGRVEEIVLASDDPDDLTLRAARLLGSADTLLHDPAVPAAILARARADARRIALPSDGAQLAGLTVIVRAAKP